jgi:hypothetical protein
MRVRTFGPLWLERLSHNHDVSGTEFGHEDLLDIGLEGLPVDRPGEDEGRDHATQSKGHDDGVGLPVAVWDPDPQALAARGAAMGAGHVGLRPGLADEDPPRGLEIGLRLESGVAPLQDIGAVLLAGVRGLFCA